MRCKTCQHVVEKEDLICPNCGNPLEKDSPQLMNEVTKIQSFASNSKGEISFSNQTLMQTMNPMLVLERKAMGMMSGLKNIFKDRRKLFLVLILAFLWILLILLPYLGFNPLPIKILSFLTFAQGGASLNSFRVIGGLVGKGVYAIFFVSLFDGEFKNMMGGMKPLLKNIKQTKKDYLPFLLIGIGTACVLYNFFAGYAALMKGMIGIASLSLILQVLHDKKGFIYAFVLASTAQRKNKQIRANQKRTEILLSGLAVGFVLSILLSIIPIGYAPYLFGALTMVIGIVFFMMNKNQEVLS